MRHKLAHACCGRTGAMASRFYMLQHVNVIPPTSAHVDSRLSPLRGGGVHATARLSLRVPADQLMRATLALLRCTLRICQDGPALMYMCQAPADTGTRTHL